MWTCTIEIKAKTILYKGHYLHDYVSPEKLTKALKWLKADNPDIDIANYWVESAITDDKELIMSMLDQPEQPECMDTGYSNNEHTNVSHGVGDVIGSSVDTSTTDDEVLYWLQQ